jgi:hypothetical protein
MTALRLARLKSVRARLVPSFAPRCFRASPEILAPSLFSRTGDPAVGEFSDAVVLKAFGEVPDDLSGG